MSINVGEKFSNPTVTLKGEPRASVELQELKTLWFNTGTLCNLSCENCYIESSPKNDRLSYITLGDVQPYLAEIDRKVTTLVGLTGGEPFMNRQIIEIIGEILKNDLEALVLTNAYRMLNKYESNLLELKESYGHKLHLRVSLDHYSATVHEKERGAGTFEKTLQNIKWLYDNDFNLSIAGRSLTEETTEQATTGYSKLFVQNNIDIDLKEKLIVFPEMQSGRDVPEITTACWGILNVEPDSMMCASERMIVKKKGSAEAVVMPCTLLAYENEFELGTSLAEAEKKVYLNHRFCAEFCVLGGASCSTTR